MMQAPCARSVEVQIYLEVDASGIKSSREQASSVPCDIQISFAMVVDLEYLIFFVAGR